MEPSQEQETIQYDAFISYSRQDKAFAALLEKELEDYKPPKDLDVPQRHLRIFRDEQDFTGSDYHAALPEHLQNSAKLTVICSAAASQSSYVDDEIRQLIKIKGSDKLVLILLSGIPNNEAKPGQESQRAFPSALCESLGMPLPADYRGFTPGKDKVRRGLFEGPWYKILADLYSKSCGQIEQREKKRQRRQRRRLLQATTVTSLVLALVGGTYAWMWKVEENVQYVVSIALAKLHLIQVFEPQMKTIPDKPFAIGQFEVTFEQYDQYAKLTTRDLPNHQWGRGKLSVINVAWADAVAYAKWLSQATGKQYRLPTKAEWRFSAQSGLRKDTWAGTSVENELKDYAVYDSIKGTEPVGVGRKPNSFDLFDMSGNVWEWVRDCYEEVSDEKCVLRECLGGSWNSSSQFLKVSERHVVDAVKLSNNIGFRLAQDLEP
ncbi:MAG TPA: SUMF1/EgtB/PvdO family nonheme iron enzyme [Nitrospira sp.]|nr:SUMF1/EgtB/PvdO family nonheme iron enzyme [Nitrospira sp.]